MNKVNKTKLLIDIRNYQKQRNYDGGFLFYIVNIFNDYFGSIAENVNLEH